MKKNAMIYYSKHHGNTKKVLDFIASKHDLDLIPVEENVDVSKYSFIGFASGTYMSKVASSITEYIGNHKEELRGKSTFILTTGGAGKPSADKPLETILSESGMNVLGSFYCYGYDTFGPFKLVGGLKKNHPDDQDFINAEKAYRAAVNKSNN